MNTRLKSGGAFLVPPRSAGRSKRELHSVALGCVFGSVKAALRAPARHFQIIAQGRNAVFVGRGEYTKGHTFKADV